VIGCDMPFVNAGLIAHELRLLKSMEVDAVVPKTEAGMEPFHAAYERHACLQAIRTALETGQRRMISWFSDARVHILNESDLRAFDPELRAFQNVNTPEEFALAEAFARQETQT